MKLTPLATTLLLLTFTTLPILADDYQDAVKCAQKDPASNSAIQAFCFKRNAQGITDNIHVPSPYASQGRRSTNGKTRASIKGTCNPPQWVPITYCNSQFHQMCAQSPRRNGWDRRNYGRRGCQEWRLERVR
ncbi:hypothetical protein TI39_contig522g00005 [Zymoseptoria brevis]|uniref:Uncharacterized protein n=1 Tax=Zymoseptoria brevis TaxID=1047168 RepID=A0A0F4GJH2_9PEZI|nr:hypothetical protein TI39_contig522g00005 [Zymoseptoria brevis]